MNTKVLLTATIIALGLHGASAISPSTTVPLYRYYSGGNGDHFYTTNWAELEGGKNGYIKEGVQCQVFSNPETGSVPLYRYYNAGNGDHFYTTSWAELRGAKEGYVFEGIQAYIFPSPVSGTVPLYRYYNGGNGDHFYTTSWSELGGGRNGYVHEGITGYVYAVHQFSNKINQKPADVLKLA